MPETKCLFYDTSLCPDACKLHSDNVGNLTRIASPLGKVLNAQLSPEETSEILASPANAIASALLAENILDEAKQSRRHHEIAVAIDKLVGQRHKFANSRDRNKCFQFNPS